MSGEAQSMTREWKRVAQKLTERDQAHLDWIEQNSTTLVDTALKLYRKSGRGAFIVQERDATSSGTIARYLPLKRAMTTAIRWPDVRIAELVRAYEPTHQFVIAFVYTGGEVSVYTIRFTESDNTLIVEAV